MDELTELLNSITVLGEPVKESENEATSEEEKLTNDVEVEDIVEKDFEDVQEEADKVEETEAPETQKYESMLSDVQKDVEGVNNFVSDLFEQKKSVSLRENALKEAEDKLAKEKAEFDHFCEEQKKLFEEEWRKIEEEAKTARNKYQLQEKEFTKEVEAIRTQISLNEHGVDLAKKALDEDKEQFEKYRETEEARIALSKESVEDSRLELEKEKEQFEKEKAIQAETVKVQKEAFEKEREQLAKERENCLEFVKEKEESVELLKKQFEDYRANEKKKLEQESKNLSESCAKIKELVSKFNSGVIK